ncbi:MAG: M23 family metallopeptidase [Bacteroidales bacterium]|nr:M23 family metallopeptidase [Bacteroidales bacterium]
MIRLKLLVKISLIILLFIARFSGFAQADFDTTKIQRVYLIESLNDSMNFANNFFEFSDEDIDFFARYTSFCFYNTHYRRTDFSNKKDTTPIPLIWGTQRFAHPCNCPPSGGATAGFGRRGWRMHFGQDFRCRTGDPIFAAFDGVVRIARRSATYGLFVVIRHHNGLETYYAHLSRLLVRAGQEVRAGELIGLCGNTGRSRGSHLHFEVRYLGAPIDPAHIINFETHELRNPVLYLSEYHFRYLEVERELNRAQFHVVRSGDTLGAIARRYGTTVNNIARLNGIRPNAIIRPGQRLRVR